jgi:DNA-directed RNA polymerase subunit L
MTSIKNIKYDNTKGSTRLDFNISGNNINYIVINTLRRMILSEIPIYAFTHFNFNKNTSVFHNNFIKNQIKNIPVWGINNKIEYYEKNKIIDNDVIDEIEDLEDNVDLSTDKKVNSTSLEQLTMYVEYDNKSNEIFTVTTNHAKFYFSQKQINNPYNIPIQLVKLQPYQSINFSVVTSIDIENNSSLFSPVSICSYDEIKENEFNFSIESRGQLIEKRIIHVAVLNLKKKLENLVTQITDNGELIGEIQINNEDHTIGNLITYYLQNHKNIQFAGYHMPHPLEKRIIISYKLKSGKFKDIFESIIKDIIELFNDINKKVDKSM